MNPFSQENWWIVVLTDRQGFYVASTSVEAKNELEAARKATNPTGKYDTGYVTKAVWYCGQNKPSVK